MLISLTVISILAISGLVWLVNKMLPLAVCPICAGVLLTWIWLVSAHFLGYEINLVVPALLMGGSVVGIAYQLEKKFSATSLLWKMFFIPAGFVAAYAVLEQLPVLFLIATVFLLASPLLLARNANKNDEAVSSIEKKMEDCC